MKIVSSEQMRRLENLSQQHKISPSCLMENAGLAVAERIKSHLHRSDDLKVLVLVLVGPGNNGGDGLVAIRHLSNWGIDTITYLCSARQPDYHNINVASNKVSTVVRLSEDKGLVQLDKALKSADMVVDAILGTGRSRPIQDGVRDVLRAVTHTKRQRPDLQILAVDLPTGVDANTGSVDPECLNVDVTIALGLPKVGLYAFPGAEYTGLVEVVDIGLPSGLDDNIPLNLMTRKWARKLIPKRPQSAHKGTFGRTLIVAGSRNYIGAAYLAAAAAGRSGAGLVTLAIPQSLQIGIAAIVPEVTYLLLPESSYGVPSSDAGNIILERVNGYQSLLVGCGLGQSPQTYELLDQLLLSGHHLPPITIDADGLNFLSAGGNDGWWKKVPSHAILTPHSGEMVRLTKASMQCLEGNRAHLALEAASRWNKVIVLKGAFTVVAFPNGQAILNPTSNPGLATAGSGDVLSGTIAGLLAQGLSIENSAALGVYLHAKAGEKVRDRVGEAGILASDLLKEIPISIRDVREGPRV